MAPRGTRPNDRIRALIRVVAERLIESSGEVVDELLSASQRGTRYSALIDDPQ